MQTVGVGTYPLSATYDSKNGYVYVTNYDPTSDNVTVINGTRVVGSVNVGTNPEYSAYDSRNGFVYVTNVNSDNVSMINGTKLVGTVTVGSRPYHLAFDSGNGYVYVGNHGTNTVSVINGTKVVATLTVGGGPYHLTYDNGNGDVYVVNQLSNNVSIVNGTRVVGSVNVGSGPEFASYDGRNGFLYVANFGGTNVSVINGTKAVGSVNVGSGPDHATYDAGNGYVYVTNQGSDSVSVINGTKVVGTVSVGTAPRTPAYDSGNGYVYVVNGGSGNVSVLNGTAIVATVSVGSYPWYAICNDGNGFVYVTNSGSNTVSVILNKYTVTVQETGLLTGAGWWVNVTGGPSTYSTTSTLSFGEYYGTYTYSVSTVNKTYAAPAGSFTVAGSTLVAIGFSRVTYPVTFSETGLTAGTDWSATLGGVTRPSTASAISFSETNGTYAYALGKLAGWATSRYAGSIIVNGSAVTRSVAWARVTYLAVFAESGLPSGTSWGINVSGGGSVLSSTGTLSFSEPNGSYSYSVSSGDRTYASPSASFSVNGATVVEAVPFTRVTFAVTLSETGLPTGTSWAVTIGGVTRPATASTITFTEPNGTYAYTVGMVPGYAADAPSGVLGVNGGDVTRTILFTPVPPATYGVTFTESGLPSGTTWSVTFNNVTETGARDLTFGPIANGTYPFSTRPTPGYVAKPNGGVVRVDGAPTSQSINFQSSAPPPAGERSPSTFLGLPGSEGYAVLGGVILAIVVGAGLLALSRRRGGETPPRPAEAGGPRRPL